MSVFGTQAPGGTIECSFPWPEHVDRINGGNKGVVFSSKGNYTTAFVEVYVDGMFIRGEGATVEQAEESAWVKYTHFSSCEEHIYEPRGYLNGLGFCINCNRSKSQAFTPEELGAYCDICKAPSYSWFHRVKKNNGDTEVFFGCSDHYREIFERVDPEGFKRHESLWADFSE